jgi:hypothetical protein
MNFTVVRDEFREDGIFGKLLDGNGKQIAVTLEHAYLNEDGSYAPKLYPGVFVCQRGQHRLEGMSSDFTTFEITGVKGHTDILFHWGNFNRDSAGCVLLGKDVVTGDANSKMITSSKITFNAFICDLDGIDTFDLIVQDDK